MLHYETQATGLPVQRRFSLCRELDGLLACCAFTVIYDINCTSCIYACSL